MLQRIPGNARISTALMALALCACESTDQVTPETGVVIRIDAQPQTKDALERVEAQLYLEQDGSWMRVQQASFPAADIPAWPIEIALRPEGPLDVTFEVLAQAIDDSGAVISRTRAISTFVKDQHSTVPLLLEDSCMVELCSDETCHGEHCDVCRGGACEPTGIAPPLSYDDTTTVEQQRERFVEDIDVSDDPGPSADASMPDASIDPGDCTDDDTQVLSDVCGLNGRGDIEQRCSDGAWVGDECIDADECTDDDTQVLSDVCGLNGRGDIEQLCSDGAWTGDECVDTDECTDDDTRTLVDSCGFNQRGETGQVCTAGAWIDAMCTDPDECVDGDDQMISDVCGLNGRGDIPESCEAGAWTAGLCVDPDECVDGDAYFGRCFHYNGTEPWMCEAGLWTADVCMLDQLYRASVGAGHLQPNQSGNQASISADGRFVAFMGRATNLVDGDDNGVDDIFVQDVELGVTLRVSVDSLGVQADGGSAWPSISADGRFVAFQSTATNLVADDTNGVSDVFVHDRRDGTTVRVSVDDDGNEGDGDSIFASISADGQLVAFRSVATNLVAGDDAGIQDIFVRDLQAGTTTRVSVGHDGSEADERSDAPFISPDGRFVTFSSFAGNLVTDDDGGIQDVFVHDRQDGSTVRASVDGAGVQGNGNSYDSSITADGRFVTFRSLATNLVAGDTNGVWDIFVSDLQLGTVERVSVDDGGNEGNGACFSPSITPDGRYVTFTSGASNLVAGDTNGVNDTFMRDRQLNVTIRLSVSSAGVEGDGGSDEASVSADGQRVAFRSSGENLVSDDNNGVKDVFLRDLTATTTTRINTRWVATQGNDRSNQPRVSGDGRIVVFSSLATTLVAGDTNEVNDVFAHDMDTGRTMRVSVSTAGQEANAACNDPAVSDDGRFVAFKSAATNLVEPPTDGTTHLYVHDLETGETILESVSDAGVPADGNSQYPALSADGRYLAFRSLGANLVVGDDNAVSDTFLRDRQLGTTIRVSVDSDGNQGNAGSEQLSISDDGRFVAFRSFATNLVANDTNGVHDIFVRDLAAGTTTRHSVDSGGNESNGQSVGPHLSSDGRYLVFRSAASNLVANDVNGQDDIFLRDVVAGTTTLVSQSTGGDQGDAESIITEISNDGSKVLFTSRSGNFDPADGGGLIDVFLRDLQAGTTVMISVNDNGQRGAQASINMSIAGNGRFAVFSSLSNNFVSGDTNNDHDVFLVTLP